MNVPATDVRDAFVDLGGRAAQRLGFARSLGQIYALLYLSEKPLGLDDLVRLLGISKGGASMSVRQLETWGAVRKVWRRGERRDFYEANTDFRNLFRSTLFGLILPRLESGGRHLAELRDALDGTPPKPRANGAAPSSAFMRERITRIESLRNRFQKLVPMIEALLK